MNQLIECKTQQEVDECCKNGDIAIVRSGIFTAYGSSQVTAYDSSQVTAYGSSQVTAYDSSQVTAYGYSQVTAYDSSQVTAYGSSQVTACGSSQVRACGYSQVTAYGSSQVTAYGSSQVTAYDSSQVTACGSSQVRACGYSQVRACGYVAITQQSDYAKVNAGKNCVLLKVPDIDGIEDYCERYPIKQDGGFVYLYKATKPNLVSFYDDKFKYPKSGTVKTDNLDPASAGSCARGLHFSHYDWAVNYGLCNDDFIILKARIKKDKIVVSPDCDGKVRTDEAEIVEVITDWRNYKPDFGEDAKIVYQTEVK